MNDPNGVTYILNSLREPLQQRTLFQKRKLLADYEQVGRHGGETVRQYVNRYKRIEKDLESVGIQSAAMYDSESRGNRLLERCRLAPDLQRLVLIAAGNSLEFDRIREALCLQFPDFRPSPAVVHGGSFGNNNGPSNNQSRSQSYNNNRFQHGKGSGSSSSSSSTSASSHGRGRSSFGAPRKVFQTEQGPDLETIDEAQHDAADDDGQDEFHEAAEHDDDETQPADREDDGDDLDDDFSGLSPEELQDLASVLTVTSRKLQSTILGRKYSGKPKSIEERKKNSTCSACGEQGHWHGDAVCSMSGTGSKGQSGRGGKGHGGGNSGKGGKAVRDSSTSSKQFPKKAFVVNTQIQHDGEVDQGESTLTIPDPSTSTTTPMTFFTFTSHLVSDPIFEVHATEIQEFSGYMVLDTACQRSCCSEDWITKTCPNPCRLSTGHQDD